MPARETSAYYSIIRYVPDPLREEAVNTGLVLAAADGSWSRFRVQPPLTKLWAMGRREDAALITDWAALVERRYQSTGFRGLFGEYGQISPEILAEWSAEFGAAIRLSPPRVAVDSDLDQLWSDLYATLVRGRSIFTTGDAEDGVQSVPRVRTARGEREQLLRDFLAVTRRWPTFDERLLRPDSTFAGLKGTHIADLAIMNGRLSGIVQVLPLVTGTKPEVITKRALLMDAALDVDSSVIKLALYTDPPADRRDLLQETIDVMGELPARQRIQAVPTRQFGTLEPQLANTLFPQLEAGTARRMRTNDGNDD